ncbi:hypothetical protein NIES3974_41750 [Calothrix sp. NIES-3974]|nr:hypothetical protein NIES3974_41750 [Calothrix sp. NIES-3974]
MWWSNSTGWRKYSDQLFGDYALRGHLLNEGGASHPWTLTRSMGAREMVGVFPPTCSSS